MAPFTVGDRALYTTGDQGPKVVTISNINYNVPYGEEPEISIQLGPDGNIRETVLNRLSVYKTPEFPPGVNSSLTPETHSQMDDIEDYMTDHGPFISNQEKKLLAELNQEDSIAIEAGEGRDYALLSIDPKDMDDFEEACNMREARHSVIASSPQGWNEGTSPDEIDCIIEYFNQGKVRKARAEGDKELDQNNRLLVEATILNKGTKHDNAVTKFGKVYIDKKFTRYVPEVGGKVKMVIGMKGCGKTHPWNCYRIV